MTLTKTQRIELRDACDTVEDYLRLLGPNVSVSLTLTEVEIADASWPGSSVDNTLFAAMKDALISIPS